MNKRWLAVVVAFWAVFSMAAQTPVEKLPVRRVVLYKNGVGYFEHTGQVRGNQDLKIDFTSSQLNDVLKSLTVLDLQGGKITGVGYNSLAPIAEQLKSLRLPLEQSTTLADFFSALRGARVQVRNGTALVSGRLLNVEEKIIKKGKDNAEQDTIKSLEISLITDAGEVRTFPLTPALGVRVEDRDLNEEITRYLGLVSSARDQDLRRMTISTAGTGDRNVFVSYISEVPVWKSTYRILLPTKPDAKPLLQGWAIVDNTVGEDWKDVELSLVAGAPQSFIQDLSRPYYTRRPVVELPEAALLTPQTHEGTMAEESKPAPPPPPSEPADQNQSLPLATRNYNQLTLKTSGVAGGSLGGVAKSRADKPASAPASLAEAAEREEASANAQDLGDLFEYNLKEKVTILKNRSALVPIISSHIDAEKVTLWSASSPRALRALWIKNTSGLTLDSGTFNIIDNNAFAGEGLIDPLKPQERRLLSYAVDQGVRVEHTNRLENRPVTHIQITHGVMIQKQEQRDHQVYTIRNSNSEARDVVIEHPVRQGWKLPADLKPEETSASFYRFRIAAKPNETATLKIDEVKPLETRYALSNLTDAQVVVWSNENLIKPATLQALQKIIQQKNEIAGLDREIQTRKAQISSIDQDQQRLRENMKALKGSPEEKALLQRYTKELNDQEDKLQAVRAEIAAREQQRDKNREQLDKMMQELTLDESM
ncbi:MAG TPA: DUF4139 domain-containing protein [Candidatus Angelobacter sp.]|jgi:hypothetical protein|nr:DUF4139 domain-containing protein [Candidatus Angelobacter sp.]